MKLRWQRIVFAIFSLVYVLSFWGYMYFAPTKLNVSGSIAGAMAFYLVSHFVRIIRLKFILSDSKLRFSQAAFISMAGDVMGAFTLKLLGEGVKVLLYSTVYRTRYPGRIIPTLIFTRSFDFLFFALIVMLPGSGSNEVNYALTLVLLLATVVLFSLLILMPRILHLTEAILLRNLRSNFSVRLIKGVQSLNNSFRKTRLLHSSSFFICLVLTLVIWLFEVVAIHFLTSGGIQNSVANSLSQTVQMVIDSALSMFTASPEVQEGMYYPLFIGLFVVTLFNAFFLIRKSKS